MTAPVQDGGRLRPPWRVLLYLPAYFLASLAIQIPLVVVWILALALLGQPPPRRIEDVPLIVQVLSALGSLVATLTITWVFRRALDRRPLLDLGLRRSREFAGQAIRGLALGVGLIALIFILERVAGWLTLDGFAWRSRPMSSIAGDLIGWLALFLCVAVSEELAFRGYVLQNLEYAWGTRAAALASAAVFAIFHGLNPGFGFLSWIGLIAAGLLLAYGYLITRALWLPIAFHWAWNFAEGPLFSFPVSGLPFQGLVEVRPLGGDPLITGGAFGPEGGLVGLGAVALGGVALWVGARARREAGAHPMT